MFAALNIDIITGQILSLQGINILILIPIILVAIIAVAFVIYRRAPQRFTDITIIKRWIIGGGGTKGTSSEELDKAIAAAGYSYDPKQDIFFSNIDAWQRKSGYCRMYDEASAPLGMIIDCEPIYFEYGGKRWLIEFWKGQYDLTAGCEIGVYTTEGPDLDIPGVFNGTFYYAASNEDQLFMSYSLKKNGKTLFTRKDKHWWLTGFKLGEFAEPWELTMNLRITLKDTIMCNAFVQGLMNAGYSKGDIAISGNSVGLKFDKTHTPQPFTRTEDTDWIIQRKNKLLCKKYQEITGPYDNFIDKINAIQQKAPELYKVIMNVGKTKKLFRKYERIRKYLN